MKNRFISTNKNNKPLPEIKELADETLWAPTVYTDPDSASFTLMLDEPEN